MKPALIPILAAAALAGLPACGTEGDGEASEEQEGIAGGEAEESEEEEEEGGE